MTKEVESSSTFVQCTETANDILSGIIKPVKGPKRNDKLPSLYCTVKMHKTPVSFRFITAGCNTVLQETSIAVGKCLKLMLNTARLSPTYRIKELDNDIFIIDNRDKVIQCINKSNISGHKGRKYLSTWDFTTLYTKIPHSILLDKITWFVNKVFDCMAKFSNPKLYVTLTSNLKSAYYSKNRSNNNVCYNASELIAAIKNIIGQAYIVYHGVVFRQCIGIPMGINSAPYFANIYLHAFEYSYLQKLISEGKEDIAKLLSDNTHRYQDDCISINDNGIFGIHYADMYDGSAMELKNTNTSRDKSNFLDLTISIYRGKFIFQSYDKRNDFNFKVVNYPNIAGNIPTSQSYGVFTSQLVRFCSVNSCFKNFVKDVRHLITTLANQHFKTDLLKSRFSRFACNHMFAWARYNNDIQSSQCLNTIFDRLKLN